jgi:putative DNA-invertase from lambdoid prophage Rac
MVVDEFEREIIRERVNSGLVTAREQGVKIGKPGNLTDERDDVLKAKKKGWGVQAIARDLEMPVASVSKVVSMAPYTRREIIPHPEFCSARAAIC